MEVGLITGVELIMRVGLITGVLGLITGVGLITVRERLVQLRKSH